MKKNIKKIALIVLTLFFIAFCLIALKNKAVINCALIKYSNNFERINNNLYISKDTPPFIKDSIFSLIRKADKRVSNFWNENKRTGNPVVIYCNNNNLLSKYSNGVGILTLKTPLGCYIIFGNERIDLDMISHEMFHTEFFSKIGFLTSIKEVPVWFDEGLAMQVDYRKDYSEEKYIKIVDSLNPQIKLSQISSPATFYSGNYYLNFIIARHEVDLWYKKAGLSGLYKLIIMINNGESFNNTFNRIMTQK